MGLVALSDALVPLESPRRLSQSSIWRMQRRYFEQRGIAAWSPGEVPHYVTTHPFIAEAYARVVHGYLRDLHATGAGGEPVHVVELGAGTGRFAFHFLRKLTALVEGSAVRAARVRYVMTDFTDASFAWWRAHPGLRPFVDSGRLDFARFDAATDGALTLVGSGETLRPGAQPGPLVVIANYVFDGIPQDVFHIGGGRLHDSLAAVHAPYGASPDDPAVLATMRLSFDRTPAPVPCYADPFLDRLVASYAASLPDTVVAFPVDAIACVRRLHRLAGGRMLLLAADRGYHREQDLLGRSEPAPTIHGSFSLPVNFHALGLAVAELGGAMLATDHVSTVLDICGFVTGVGEAHETRLAFDDAIAALGPDDFFLLRKALEPHHAALTLPQLVALLRTSGYDATVFRRILPALKGHAEQIADPRELAGAVLRVWAAHFRTPDEPDLAFDAGVLLYELGQWRDALELFACSLRDRGPDAACLYNAGMCHVRLNEVDAARDAMDRALALDAAFEPARTMRIRLK